MKNIKVIDYAHQIENTQLKELYLSKLAYVVRILSYHDETGVDCTVTFHCEIVNKKLSTRVDIECGDAGFRDVLSEATRAYNIGYE